MKRAKQIFIDEEKVLSKTDFEDLISHGRNSASWYSFNGIYSANDIKDKMMQKGYPNEEIEVQTADGTSWLNLIDEILKSLGSIVRTDEEIAEIIVTEQVRKGRGPTLAFQKLRDHKLNEMTVDTALAEYPISESLQNAIERAERKSNLKDDRQKTLKWLMTQGFKYGDILEQLGE